MISSASSPDRGSRAETVSAANANAPRAFTLRPDRISTESAAFLSAALARTPEVRPEVVARARELASDPSYPPPAVIQFVAQRILAAPDLSESED